MARIAGLFEHGTRERVAGEPSASALWSTLTRNLGEARVEHTSGSAHVALYADHCDEHMLAPGGAAPQAGFALGFGGDAAADSMHACVPPWLDCRYWPAEDKLAVATDRHGLAPLYVRRVGCCTLFCSSAAALGCVEPPLAFDRDALAEMLAFDHLLGTRSYREGISLLALGHELHLDRHGARLERRFAYGDIPLSRVTEPATLARELASAFQVAMSRTLAQRQSVDDPVLVPLSGGLDSRLLAASAVAAGAMVESFTFGRTQSPPAPDVAIGSRIASALSIPWRFVALGHDWLAQHAERAVALTDGELDILHSAGVSVLDELPHGRLRLDGLWGGIELGGKLVSSQVLGAVSREQQLALLWHKRSRIERSEWQALLLPSARSELAQRARDSLARSLDDVIAELAPGDPRWANVWAIRHRARRFTNQGPRLWQACARSVFAFFEPAFFGQLFAVHPRVRARGQLQAALFHHAFPAMTEIAWQRTGRAVPKPGALGKLASWLRRPQYARGQGFFDADAALRASSQLQSFLRDRLLDPISGIARFDCFDRAGIEELLSDVIGGRRQGMQQLGLLATLVLAEQHWQGRSA